MKEYEYRLTLIFNRGLLAFALVLMLSERRAIIAVTVCMPSLRELSIRPLQQVIAHNSSLQVSLFLSVVRFQLDRGHLSVGAVW